MDQIKTVIRALNEKIDYMLKLIQLNESCNKKQNNAILQLEQRIGILEGRALQQDQKEIDEQLY